MRGERREQPVTSGAVAGALGVDVGFVRERRGGGRLNGARHHQPGVLAYLAEVLDQVRVAGDEPGPQSGHVRALRERVHREDLLRAGSQRRDRLLPALAAHGIHHAGGSSTFYLWLSAPSVGDGWALTAELARVGILIAPGELYGDAGAAYARLALTVTDEQVDRIVARLAGW